MHVLKLIFAQCCHVFPFPVIKYRVTICTGNVGGGGTDASVFLNIIGDLGDTGERLMIMSKNNVNKFEKGNVRAPFPLNDHGIKGDVGKCMHLSQFFSLPSPQHDEFLIESVSLGQVCRVRVGHDGRGGGCGWFLDKVTIREEGQPESSAIDFPCFRQGSNNYTIFKVSDFIQ